MIIDTQIKFDFDITSHDCGNGYTTMTKVGRYPPNYYMIESV